MKVFQIIWMDPAMFQAIIFTAQMLSECGISVDLLYRLPNPHMDVAGDVDFGKGTRLLRTGGGHTGWRDKLDFAVFLLKAIALTWREKPDAIIGYNMAGIAVAFLASRLSPQTTLVYHNFDINAKETLGPFGRLIIKPLELAGARHSHRVILPSAGRVPVFKDEARLRQEPVVVMNCQRLCISKQETGELRGLLESKGLSFDRIVLRLGSIGPYHGIEATIRSIPEWQGNWGFVLGGFPEGSFMNKMQRLVDNLNLGDRVIFLPSISYSLWYDCLYSAHVGISLYEPVNVNHANMAGAGQKLHFYLKAGIPGIVPNLPDFIEFIERYGAGKVAETTDPHSVATAINAILSDPKEYGAYCRNAKHAFMSEFNFEKQFEPVLNWLVSKRHNVLG